MQKASSVFLGWILCCLLVGVGVAAPLKSIPGLGSGDLTTGMKSALGMEFSGFRDLPGDRIRCGSRLADPSGITCCYGIEGTTPSKLDYITFSVDRRVNGSPVGSLAEFRKISAGFLGYGATLPYDGANQDKAQAWVKSAALNVKPGEERTMKVGGVVFELSMNKKKDFMILVVRAEGYQE